MEMTEETTPASAPKKTTTRKKAPPKKLSHTREFLFGGAVLEDPDKAMTEQQVLEHYSQTYKHLTKGEITILGQENGVTRYELRKGKYQPNG